MDFTLDERSELVLIYAEAENSARATAQIFHQRHPDRPKPHHTTIARLMSKFLQTGTVADKPRSGRTRSATDSNNEALALKILRECPDISTRQLARQLNISPKSVVRILRKLKSESYEQSLGEGSRCSVELDEQKGTADVRDPIMGMNANDAPLDCTMKSLVPKQ